MASPDTAKPAPARGEEPVSKVEQLGSGLGNLNTSPFPALQLRCELIGSGEVIGAGLTAHGVSDMCRQLVAGGTDPGGELLCFRDGRLALRVRSIGHGARLTVRETATDGPRFTTWRPFPAARSGHPFVKIASPSIPGSSCAHALKRGARGVAASPIGAAVDRIIDHGGADG